MFRFLLSAALLSAGCTQVVPATARALMGVSVLETDPAAYQIVLNLPDGVDVAEDSAALRLTAEHGDDALDQTFVLARSPGAQGAMHFAVAETDLPALRAAQAKAQAWEAADPDATSGSLGLSFAPCLTDAGAVPDGEVSAGLVMVQNGPVRPLLRPQPVARYLDMIEKQTGAPVPTCADVAQR